MQAESFDLHGLPPAMAYVPMQKIGKRYSDETALLRGTLFPELDLPFKDFINTCELPKTLLAEVMKLDFVCHELALYLDTHPYDRETEEYFNQCVLRSRDARSNFEESGRMLFAHSIRNKSRGHDWLDNPWPWE